MKNNKLEFETINKNYKAKIIIGVGALLILISVVMFVGTRSKYRSVQSLKLARGIVKYNAPDLHLVAIKVSEDGKTYNPTSTLPEGDYTLNEEKSKCRIPTSTLTGEEAPVANGVTIEYTNGRINVLGLLEKNTKCYIYFDKVRGQTPDTIIADIEKSSYFKTGTPTFGKIATGTSNNNNGVFKAVDGMYEGESYYWRGQALTNHVIFDNKCWRIVRINGDKSIRLIYNGTPSGTTCPRNGNNAAVIMGSSIAEENYATSDVQDNNPSYVGWVYTLNTHKTLSGTESNAKNQTEIWYRKNISTAAKTKVDSNGKFCGDRNTGTPPSTFGWHSTYATSWNTQTGDSNRFAYAAAMRLYETYSPTLSCPNGDVYTLSVGAITADEVMFAGGKNEDNASYYLYTSQNYWTMSPSHWDGSSAFMFIVGESGNLGSTSVSSPRVNIRYGLRPVINLKADTLFNLGSDGTQNNPYIVQ